MESPSKKQKVGRFPSCPASPCRCLAKALHLPSAAPPASSDAPFQHPTPFRRSLRPQDVYGGAVPSPVATPPTAPSTSAGARPKAVRRLDMEQPAAGVAGAASEEAGPSGQQVRAGRDSCATACSTLPCRGPPAARARQACRARPSPQLVRSLYSY
jgi:hypothetical protein